MPIQASSIHNRYSNCLSIQLIPASNQELEIPFVYNPNHETDKNSNLRKAVNHSTPTISATPGKYTTPKNDQESTWPLPIKKWNHQDVSYNALITIKVDLETIAQMSITASFGCTTQSGNG